MLYICWQKSIIKMDTDVFLLLSFKLMAQYILHTLPLLKTAKPKKNSNTIIFFGDNDHTVIAHLKKRLCSVRVPHCSFRTCSFVSALATYCTKTEMIRDFFSVNLRVQCACKSENCHLLHLSGTRTLLLF